MKHIFSSINLCFFLLLPVFCFSQTMKFTVAQDGTGDFTSVQSALDAVPEANHSRINIFIKNGTYKEVIVVDARKNFISLIGENNLQTILTYDNHSGVKLPNGDTLNTRTCASFFVYGNDFHAENITFQNTAGSTAGQ